MDKPTPSSFGETAKAEFLKYIRPLVAYEPKLNAAAAKSAEILTAAHNAAVQAARAEGIANGLELALNNADKPEELRRQADAQWALVAELQGDNVNG